MKPVVILTIFLVSLFYLYIMFDPRVRVTSSSDGRTYLVQDVPDKQAAADTLAELNTRASSMIHALSLEYPTDVSVNRLSRYSGNLEERITGSSGTSWTVDKGKRIVLCLRNIETGQITGINLLMFILLHELAHIMSLSNGHGKEFVDNFKRLIRYSIDKSYYRYTPYDKQPGSYCGTTIKNQVLSI